MNTTETKPLASQDPRRGLPSASGVERLMLCPSSPRMERGIFLPDDELSAAGTRIHFALATDNTSGLDNHLEIDSYEACNKQCDSIAFTWLALFHLDLLAGFPKSIQDATHRERRLWIRDANGKAICSVQIDRFILIGKVALVIDTKTGWGEQTPPSSNWQLRTAAVALWQNFGVTNVRVVIVQPFKRPMPPCDYTEDDLKRSYDLLLAGLDAANKLDAPLVPGDKQCQWCRAKTTCPAALAKVAELPVLATGLTSLTPRGRLFINERWSTLAPEQKVNLFESARFAVKIAEAILDQVKSELVAGPDSIPGLVKKPDQELRTVDLIGLLNALLGDTSILSLGEKEITDRVTALAKIGTTDSIELYRELKGCTKKEAEAFFDKPFPWIKRAPKSGGIGLVKE